MWRQVSRSGYQFGRRSEGRVKPLWITFFLGFGILFSFQNCQKAPYVDEINYISRNGQLVQSPNKVVLAEQRLLQFQLFSKTQQTVFKNGNAFSLIVNRIYEFNFDSAGVRKQFVVSSEDETQPSNLCLSEPLQSELQNIIAAAAVCRKSAPVSDPNRLCAAVIVSAYASIQTESERFNLGAASDACLTNLVDFCNDEGTLIKGFTKYLDTQLKELNCN